MQQTLPRTLLRSEGNTVLLIDALDRRIPIAMGLCANFDVRGLAYSLIKQLASQTGLPHDACQPVFE